MYVMAAGARNLAQVRGMRIGLIFCGFRGELGVSAVAFDACCLIRLF